MNTVGSTFEKDAALERRFQKCLSQNLQWEDTIALFLRMA